MKRQSTQSMIKDISSNFVRADVATRCCDKPDELKHLLFATHDISILLLNCLNDVIDESTAKEYAKSLENTATRIKELIEDGVR